MFRTALERAQKELRSLMAKVDKLEDELWRVQGEVGSGQHVPPGIRVLELAGNPARAWFGKREEDVDRLKKENQALRVLVGDGQIDPLQLSGGIGEGLVPKETVDVLQREKAELEQTIRDREKQLLRLRQVS